jgi:hypothetical protein
MDDIDRITEQTEIYQRAALYKSKRPTENAIATGCCLFCEAPLDDGIRWCGKECRDDWLKENDK